MSSPDRRFALRYVPPEDQYPQHQHAHPRYAYGYGYGYAPNRPRALPPPRPAPYTANNNNHNNNNNNDNNTGYGYAAIEDPERQQQQRQQSAHGDDQPSVITLRPRKSLVRLERRRFDRGHPNYHYRQHVLGGGVGGSRWTDATAAAAAGMRPAIGGGGPYDYGYANAGVDDDDDYNGKPIRENEDVVQLIPPASGEQRNHRRKDKPRVTFANAPPTVNSPYTPEDSYDTNNNNYYDYDYAGGGGGVGGGKTTWKTRRHRRAAEKKRQAQLEHIKPPSLWNVYCAALTFWAPDALLRHWGGMPMKAQRRAWREKLGLISVILVIAAFVGFLTFGFTAAVCDASVLRLAVNHVAPSEYVIAHGTAYSVRDWTHPAAYGVPGGSNILYDLPHKYGGEDISFMFQNVNGACKGLVKPKKHGGGDIPQTHNGDVGWYFPCVALKQDGSSEPNSSYSPPYAGHACHTSARARDQFYNHLKPAGDVYFKWADIANSSRNLVVWSNSVLDLDRLRFLNASAVSYPSAFDKLRTDKALRGGDVTRLFQAGANKRHARCLTELVRVGSVDTDTIGCIASKVVLYVSLVFILSVVLVKFFLALAFQWFLARQYAAPRSNVDPGSKERQRQIEDWSNDLNQPAPAPTPPLPPGSDPDDTVSAYPPLSKRFRFLPTTSRFTNPYLAYRPPGRDRRSMPVTMTSQSQQMQPAPQPAPQPPQSRPHHSSNPFSAVHMIDPSSPLSHSGVTTRIHDDGRDDNDDGSIALTDMKKPATTAAAAPVPDGDGSGSGMELDSVHAGVIPQPPAEWQPFGYPLAHVLCLVTCYSEGGAGLRTTLDSVAATEYPSSHKTIIVVCDGMVQGHGEPLATPDIALSMMSDFVVPPQQVRAYSYVAVATGKKRHNMARVYAGFYDYGVESRVPVEQQGRVPMMVVVKCGTPEEEEEAAAAATAAAAGAGTKRGKPGNRGKRDSQIVLMSFLQKVMFDERMTELEYEMFNGLWRVTGISPDFYEALLMLDADTKIYPDSLTHMVAAMVRDRDIMGLCGESQIANKTQSWVTMIQVFEYFVSHHLSKSFESVFGGVTCLPGCFSMYRIKAPKGEQNYYWVPILANPDVVENYSENVVDTLHKKNLLLLGEDRYLSTLMLKTFPKRKQVFVPQAVCKTVVPDAFRVLLSQRRRWINSTVHNLMELVLVRDLCGTFCFSMQFVVFMELVGTVVLPAAIAFTFYVLVTSIIHRPPQIIPLVLLALVLGLPGVLVVVTAHHPVYVAWMLVYLVSLPIWNFVLPTYAYWKFDDFSWGDTRKTAGAGEKNIKTKTAGIEYEGEFDSSKITMKRWAEFQRERREAKRNQMQHGHD